MEHEQTNREKKVEGRRKREEYVQGKRSYLHAMVNSIVRRGESKGRRRKGKSGSA